MLEIKLVKRSQTAVASAMLFMIESIQQFAYSTSHLTLSSKTPVIDSSAPPPHHNCPAPFTDLRCGSVLSLFPANIIRYFNGYANGGLINMLLLMLIFMLVHC